MKRLTLFLAIGIAVAACGGMPDEVEDDALAAQEQTAPEQEQSDTQQDSTEDISATVAANAVHCGGNITTYRWGGGTYQRLTYVSCSSRTLRRKADVARLGDGPCMTIPPFHTVVLHPGVPYRPPFQYIRGSKEC